MAHQRKESHAGSRWGMTIDLDKCSGCQACSVACKSENNIPFGTEELWQEGREMNWMAIIPTVEGEYPNLKVSYMPRPCMHCDEAPCTKVCPVHATYVDDEGIVAQIYHRCIGCRYCTVACPYTVKYFNWFAPHWPQSMQSCFNPDVSVRQRGVVEKCTFCSHRLIKAREKAALEKRELVESDYQPACADACPSSAITFGDLHNNNHRVHKLSRSNRAERLLEDLGTEPKVFYLSKDETL